jgi:hypothetical protein
MDYRNESIPGHAANVSYVLLDVPSMIAIVIVGYVVYETCHTRKFGVSTFTMASVPGRIGGELAGVIRARLRSVPEDVLRLKLTCTKTIAEYVSGRRGKSKHTKEITVWQECQEIPVSKLRTEEGLTVIPVRFQIPATCEPTRPESEETPNPCFTWQLDADVTLPGVNYHSEFTLPVFRVDRAQ